MFTPSGRGPADVVVGDDGRIAAVTPVGHVVGGNVAVDATGLCVIPGLIDAHVHLDEPGRTEWEGFATGSAAAVAGGVTTLVDMPIDCDPPTITAAAVDAKAAAVAAHSVADVAMWGGLVPTSVNHLDAMLEAGVVGFKAFACPSGWDDFPPADEATLTAGCTAAARANVPVAVHCETEALGRTVESEVAAVRWTAAIAGRVGARLHVVHVSSPEAVDEARRWAGVTVETCPHYLVLDEHEVRCFPPVRSASAREGLWHRLLSGAIDLVASDHSPCLPSQRETWAGVDGLGMTLPVLLATERLPLAHIVALNTAAARVLRLPGKGAIAPGYDADLVLLDPTARWTVDAGSLRTRHRASPYIGRRVRGEVITTMVRGAVTFSQKTVTRDRGGRVIRRFR